MDADGNDDRDARADWWGVVLDAPSAPELARFYSDLLGWEISRQSPNEQQMMLHLDFEVSDLDLAVGHALELGAQEADHQPQENVRVMLDPVGHPFCLYVGG